MKKITIQDGQRGLKISNGRVKEILEPGVYWNFDIFSSSTKIEVYDVSQPEFLSLWADVIVSKYEIIHQKYFVTAAPKDNQVALIYRDENFYRLIEPGKRMTFWNLLSKIEVEYVDISEDQAIPEEKAVTLVKRAPQSDQFLFATVPEAHIAVLYIDGKLVKTLKPGAYAYWKGKTSIQMSVLDLRLQSMEISGQEILTKDKVSLRLNFEAFFKIVDPLKAVGETQNLNEYLYKEFQLALRKVIGSRTLDEILQDKESLSSEVVELVKSRALKSGVSLENTGVKDIILPGEMKEIMNQVVSAEKAAQANLIRRREEVAATRSLMNTARMIESNPVLMRLKELEALEKVADKIDSIQVTGGLEQILNQIKKT